ncbi:MAG: hypothetical protein M0R51_10730 [Clostridia bacterium]|jgi:hypothetical protein|nr:hypothetical protein [Clostridia bacterium]
MTNTLKEVVSKILKTTRNSYMKRIAKKALSLNKPLYYPEDLLHDSNVLSKFKNSEIESVYWFVRDSGTHMLIFTNRLSGASRQSNYNEIKEELVLISELWDSNKHHFYVTPNTCRYIIKDDFIKKVTFWLESGRIIYKSL